MPCYHPIQAFYDRELKKVYFSHIPRVALLTHLDAIEEVKLPCGKCIGCRLERSRKWAMRCVYEAQLHDENSFLTLTYAPENLPSNGSLCKRHLQLFMKRLRKAYPGGKIRYFACGEYGEKFSRPHYHVILFGFCPPDFKKKRKLPVSSNSPLAAWFGSSVDPRTLSLVENKESNLMVCYSPQVEKIWGLGKVAVGEVSFESCAYVARYCLKKVNGDKAKAHYGDRLPEFVVMSRRPGIAGDWFDRWKDDVFPADKCFARGVPCKPPRYFDKLFEKISPGDFEQLKLARKAFAARHEVPIERLFAAEEIVTQNLEKYARKFEKKS